MRPDGVEGSTRTLGWTSTCTISDQPFLHYNVYMEKTSLKNDEKEDNKNESP